MRLEKNYCGKQYSLLIVKNHGKLMFKVDDRIFESLTAAARHVYRDETRQVNGPEFWGAPRADK